MKKREREADAKEEDKVNDKDDAKKPILPI